MGQNKFSIIKVKSSLASPDLIRRFNQSKSYNRITDRCHTNRIFKSFRVYKINRKQQTSITRIQHKRVWAAIKVNLNKIRSWRNWERHSRKIINIISKVDLGHWKIHRTKDCVFCAPVCFLKSTYTWLPFDLVRFILGYY